VELSLVFKPPHVKCFIQTVEMQTEIIKVMMKISFSPFNLYSIGILRQLLHSKRFGELSFYFYY